MQTNRRQFLRLLGSTAPAIALSPLTAIALDDSQYVNRKLGVELAKPAGWHFLSVRDFQMFAESHSAESRDRELFDELRDLSGDPILVAAQHREGPPDVSASIVVYANPAVSLDGTSLVEYSRSLERAVSGYLQGYELEVSPRSRAIPGCDAAVYQYRYVLRLTDGRELPFRCKYLIAHTARAEFCIPLECPVGDSEPAAELERFLESLTFF